MRWLLAMIKHETNTFSPVPTGAILPRQRQAVSGDAAVALRRHQQRPGRLPGRGARDRADVTIPVAAAAWPRPGQTYRQLCQPVLDELARGGTTRCCWTCTAPW